MAATNNHIFLLVCAIFHALCSGYVAQPQEPDHFKLVQQWPPAFCNINNCVRTVQPMKFTIHGLWPDKINGQLNDCYVLNGADRFSKIRDANLLKRLDASWRDLTRPIPYVMKLQEFWEKEWDKHGTCSWNLFRQQKLYFEKALVLKDKFDLLTILQQNQINPGSNVDVRRVTSIISRATGGDPIVKCTTNRRAKSTKEALQLTEIIICFDYNAVSVIPCPRPKNSYNYGCKSDVHFPK